MVHLSLPGDSTPWRLARTPLHRWRPAQSPQRISSTVQTELPAKVSPQSIPTLRWVWTPCHRELVCREHRPGLLPSPDQLRLHHWLMERGHEPLAAVPRSWNHHRHHLSGYWMTPLAKLSTGVANDGCFHCFPWMIAAQLWCLCFLLPPSCWWVDSVCWKIKNLQPWASQTIGCMLLVQYFSSKNIDPKKLLTDTCSSGRAWYLCEHACVQIQHVPKTQKPREIWYLCIYIIFHIYIYNYCVCVCLCRSVRISTSSIP